MSYDFAKHTSGFVVFEINENMDVLNEIVHHYKLATEDIIKGHDVLYFTVNVDGILNWSYCECHISKKDFKEIHIKFNNYQDNLDNYCYVSIDKFKKTPYDRLEEIDSEIAKLCDERNRIKEQMKLDVAKL